MQLGNNRIITILKQRNVFPFFSLYRIYASDVKSAHTHVNVLFKDIIYFVLRGEGRRNQEGME